MNNVKKCIEIEDIETYIVLTKNHVYRKEIQVSISENFVTALIKHRLVEETLNVYDGVKVCMVLGGYQVKRDDELIFRLVQKQ